MQNWRNIPRRQVIAGACLTSCLLLSLAGLWCSGTARRESRALTKELEKTERTVMAQIDRLSAESRPDSTREYVLRTCEGKIGVYNGDETVLYEILDVDVRTLPQADRAQLEAGITVFGEAALRALTEDYTS